VHAATLVAAGGVVLREVDDPREGAWVVMADPEGNEFCVA
jgi:predicted enzyme related to lactoylglutathione lyase